MRTTTGVVYCERTPSTKKVADHPTIRIFWEISPRYISGAKETFLSWPARIVYPFWTWKLSIKVSVIERKLYKFFPPPTIIPAIFLEQIIIQRTAGGDSYLPVARTYFNLLDLPLYNTKQKLRYKLIQAIQQTQGFALESF